MIKNKPLYVIRFNNGTFWCGYNTIDKQIRKAVIYSSIKYAKEAANDVLQNQQRLKKNKKANLPIKSYQILEVDIIIKNVVEEKKIV